MKTLPIPSLALGVCLLALSAGAALAANPHPFTTTGAGQPGSNNGISCGDPLGGTNVTIAAGPSGGSLNANGSPFAGGVSDSHYAGNPGTHSLASNNPNAVSQYDVSCFQHTQLH
jgi:hypothetical protein